MRYRNSYHSPIGKIILASDGESLTGLWFDGRKCIADILSKEHEKKNLPVFELTKKWLDGYFGGGIPNFTPPLFVDSTPFRLAVLDILKKIPYGQVTTYGEIADIIARKNGMNKMSAQAVGGAVGYNPISIIIPCHRVIGSNGNLTGFGGGMDRKIALLTLEKIDMKSLFIPKNWNDNLLR